MLQRYPAPAGEPGPHCLHRYQCHILSRTSPNQAEQIRPPWPSILPPVRAVMQSNHELLPRKNLIIREISRQSQVVRQLLLVHIDVLRLKTLSDMFHQCLDIFGRLHFSCLHCLHVGFYSWITVCHHRHPLWFSPWSDPACPIS